MVVISMFKPTLRLRLVLTYYVTEADDKDATCNDYLYPFDKYVSVVPGVGTS